MLVDDARLARLRSGRFGRLLQLEATPSTNTVAAARAGAGEPEGLVVVADFQTAGRGRYDRRWEAPPGTSLLFSVLLRPGLVGLPGGRRHLAVAALSLAVTDAAALVCGAALRLKWPNDVVAPGPAGDQKVAGLLAEAAAGDALVVGAGINVSWAPEGLAATSLAHLSGAPVDRAEVLVSTLMAFDTLYGDWARVAGRYRAECATVGRQVVVDLGPGQPALAGRATAVDEDGHLLVASVTGELVRVAAGDVVHTGSAPGA